VMNLPPSLFAFDFPSGNQNKGPTGDQILAVTYSVI
jgi:hypothetical protein